MLQVLHQTPAQRERRDPLDRRVLLVVLARRVRQVRPGRKEPQVLRATQERLVPQVPLALPELRERPVTRVGREAPDQPDTRDQRERQEQRVRRVPLVLLERPAQQVPHPQSLVQLAQPEQPEQLVQRVRPEPRRLLQVLLVLRDTRVLPVPREILDPLARLAHKA